MKGDETDIHNTTTTEEVKIVNAQTVVVDKSNVVGETEEEILEVYNSAGDENVEEKKKGVQGNDDAWLKFGMATLSVVVGGVLLSAQGGGNANNYDDMEGNHSDAEYERQKSTKSSVRVIEESIDDDDDEWISVGRN